MKDDIKNVVMIGVDGEDYVHLLSYVDKETTKDLLMDALEILEDLSEEGLDNYH